MNHKLTEANNILPARHFFYANDFGMAERAAIERVTEPTFSLADLNEAEQRGRVTAFAEAATAREFEEQRLQVNLINTLGAAIEEAKETARVMATVVAEELTQAIIAMTATFLPTLCASQGAAEVIAMVKRLAPALRLEPKVVIRVHETMLLQVEETLLSLAPELRRSMEISPLANCSLGDVHISWKDGYASRTVTEIEAHLLNALKELGLGIISETKSIDLLAPKDRGVNPARSLEIANAR